MQAHLRNFTRATLIAGIASGDSQCDVEAGGGIWGAPPAPAGGRLGVLVLADDLQSPGAVEVIRYAGRTALGGVQYRLTGLERGCEGSAAAAWLAGAHVLATLTVGAVAAPGANLLINGDGQIDQYQHAAGAADAVYGPDRWLTLQDGTGYVQPGIDAVDYPPGAAGALKWTVTASGNRFAALQIVEASACAALLGGAGQASAQLRAKGTGIATLKAAVLAWTGTADAPTRDCVATWNAAGTTPTLATNWVYESAVTTLALGAAWSTPQRIEGVPIDAAGAKQIALFVWIDEAVTAGDVLRLAGVKLEEGPRCTAHVPANISQEELRAYRYRQQSFQSAGDARGYSGITVSVAAANLIGSDRTFLVPMRAIPTITWRGTGDTPGNIRNLTTAAEEAISVTNYVNQLSTGSVQLAATPSVGHRYVGRWQADAEL
jgi:hypothetical protein